VMLKLYRRSTDRDESSWVPDGTGHSQSSP
jgi:hypothetical protein